MVDLPVIAIIEKRLVLAGMETPLMMLVAVKIGTAKRIAATDAARAMMPSLRFDLIRVYLGV